MMYLLWQRYLYLAFDLHRLHPFHLPLLLHHDCPSLRYRRFQLKWYDRVQAKWIQNHSIFQSKRNVIREFFFPLHLKHRVSWIKTLNVVKYLHRLCLDQVQRVELCRKVTDQRQFVEWTLAKHKSKCSSDKIQKKFTNSNVQRNVQWLTEDLTHETCSFSISRNSDSSSHGVSASMHMLLPTVGRSDGKNGIIDIIGFVHCALFITLLDESVDSFVLRLMSNKLRKWQTANEWVDDWSTLNICNGYFSSYVMRVLKHFNELSFVGWCVVIRKSMKYIWIFWKSTLKMIMIQFQLSFGIEWVQVISAGISNRDLKENTHQISDILSHWISFYLKQYKAHLCFIFLSL